MNKSKVAIIRSDDYDEDKVFEALKKGIDLLGGAESIIKTGEKILLKPNVLVGDKPEKGSTTNPAVLKGVARIFQGAGGNMVYGDSPGFGPIPLQMRLSGLSRPMEDLNIPLEDFASGKEVPFPESPLNKTLFLANGALEAEGIINVCKMKTHFFQKMTGAVKNLFGCVPGAAKAEYHLKIPSPFDFAKMLCAIQMYLKPRLHIMDGIMAMEGNGPRSGNMVPMRVILLSKDPVALDTIACKLMNLDPAFVPTITEGIACGLGNGKNIDIVGEDMTQYIKKDFDIIREPVRDVELREGFLKFMSSMIANRPVINKKLCVRCGICIKVCPVKPYALDWKKGNKKNPPVYNYNRCIRCFCCQELCPEKAITVKRPFIGSLLVKN